MRGDLGVASDQLPGAPRGTRREVRFATRPTATAGAFRTDYPVDAALLFGGLPT
jgi:hypothetical protein